MRSGRVFHAKGPAIGVIAGPRYSLSRKRLPDVHALLGRQVQRVARLDVERGVPGVDVADDAVDAELGGRVRSGEQRRTLRARPHFGLPRLGIGEEEALVAGQPADHLRLAMLRL